MHLDVFLSSLGPQTLFYNAVVMTSGIDTFYSKLWLIAVDQSLGSKQVSEANISVGSGVRLRYVSCNRVPSETFPNAIS